MYLNKFATLNMYNNCLFNTVQLILQILWLITVKYLTIYLKFYLLFTFNIKISSLRSYNILIC